MLRENDVIRVLGDHPKDGIATGELGSVLCVFDTPTEAYEVEFVDEYGNPKAQLTLARAEIEPVHYDLP